ncbi:MAG: hypothetical protein IT326_01790 [Anaerolineae bacterium]|nr:hypothetical protein [Anaerolineae bacterium]
MSEMYDFPIAHVLRAGTAGFSAGARVEQIDQPAFGMVVRAQPRGGTREVVYGLLYDIHIDDDPLVRQLVLANTLSEEIIRDQHHHRIVPVEMSVISIGYRGFDGRIHYALPPRPPISLDPVYLCNPEETRAVTQQFDYFRMVLSNGQVPGEQLLAATLLMAATMLPEREQYPFLVEAGREAARLLSNEQPRLDNLLRLIYPNHTR